MKSKANPVILILLVLSVFCNIFFLCNTQKKQKNTFFTFGSDRHSIEIYIEKTAADKISILDQNNLFTVGDIEFIDSDEGIILYTKDERINLTESGTRACIVKQNGEVLYHFDKYKESEMVFVTPSGNKYHYKASCAGRNAFEAPLEAAMLFREPCSICT